jgi:cytochrome c peroxidase
MGPTLADGINQGAAGPDQFRTAPLWGVGQRLFFLHDGRTSDLRQAILAHASANGCQGPQAQGPQSQGPQGQGWQGRWPGQQGPQAQVQQNCGSEANAVIRNFKALSPSQVQDLLNFLRSL